jgi:hypothetical protein
MNAIDPSIEWGGKRPSFNRFPPIAVNFAAGSRFCPARATANRWTAAIDPIDWCSAWLFDRQRVILRSAARVRRWKSIDAWLMQQPPGVDRPNIIFVV